MLILKNQQVMPQVDVDNNYRNNNRNKNHSITCNQNTTSCH